MTRIDPVALARRCLAELAAQARAEVIAELELALRRVTARLHPPPGTGRPRLQAERGATIRVRGTPARPGRRPRKEARALAQQSAPPGEPPVPSAERPASEPARHNLTGQALPGGASSVAPRLPSGGLEDPLAGTTRGLTAAVAPDLVLPPGFDRVGEVVRFEQDERAEAGAQATTGPGSLPPELAPPPAPDSGPGAVEPDRGLLAVSTPPPAGEGQEPALSRRRGHPGREVTAARWAMGGVDVIPCTRCGLRGHLAGDPDRCLFYRGGFGLGGQAAQTERAL